MRAINNPGPAYTTTTNKIAFKHTVRKLQPLTGGESHRPKPARRKEPSSTGRKKCVGSIPAALKNKGKNEGEKKKVRLEGCWRPLRVGDAAFTQARGEATSKRRFTCHLHRVLGVSLPPPTHSNVVIHALHALNSSFLVSRLIRQLKLGCIYSRCYF